MSDGDGGPEERARLITVAGALQLSPLRRGAPETVAGRAHLDRRIRWVHSGEVPNIAELLKGGELLLTTGMGIGGDDHAQRAFITALAERRVAAVVIELGEVFERLPAALVQAAEEKELPLIALHRRVPFIEVTEAIHASIVNRQLAVLRRGEEIHRRFTELMVEGAGIPEVLAVLATTIANPVLLEKAGHGVLYQAGHRSSESDVLGAWEEVRRDADRGIPIQGRAVVVPVAAAGHSTWGRLAGLALDAPLDDFDRVAIERAVGLVALALLRARQEELLAARARGNLLADVAAGRVGAVHAAERAGALGFRARGQAMVPLALLPEDDAGAGWDEAAWGPVWRTARERLQAAGSAVLLGSRAAEGDVLGLLALKHPDRRTEAVDAAVEAVRSAIARHLGSGTRLVAAAGPVVRDWAELPRALTEAAETAAGAHGSPSDGWHDATSPDVDRLLWTLRDDPHLRAFVRRRLGPLLEHDRRRAAKLLPTLDALFAHGGRKAETARALHLERQSLYHRLRRIEGLLGGELDDPQTRLGLELALRALAPLSDATPRELDADASAWRPRAADAAVLRPRGVA